jgi:phosphopantetheinyl transferase (holo-ACP synthase)
MDEFVKENCIHLSISHEEDIAAAFVIIEKNSKKI